jgi:photosynthetic reaction center cytochrome c subunit
MRAWHPIAVIIGVLVAYGLFTNNWSRPPVQSVQEGYRGLGMVQVTDLRQYLANPDVDKLPAPIPEVAAGGPTAGEQYKNLKVLNDISSSEFLRLMAAITAWVSPQQGCAYCHDGANFASDAKYAKIVARRMIQMTREINQNWKSHVAMTGVTCYTCHRGNPVPMNIWYSEPGNNTVAGQNHPSEVVGSTSLPSDPFSGFFANAKDANSIRIIGNTALQEGNRHSIKQAEYTYGLMMAISKSLGVNCVFCHNSRSFFDWQQSSPKRTLAWHGIQMVRNLNMTYLDSLTSVLPPNRLGPHGQPPQISCATCHQGARKPLMGVSLVKTFPELQGGEAENDAPTDQGSPQ